VAFHSSGRTADTSLNGAGARRPSGGAVGPTLSDADPQESPKNPQGPPRKNGAPPLSFFGVSMGRRGRAPGGNPSPCGPEFSTNTLN
jgi:hypothetical protein